jgi:hypothetical protein
MKKLGAIFMVTVFALAGVGVSYAGFFDIINVHGEVSTAYVDYEFVDWSGTWVWKNTNLPNEIEIQQGSYDPALPPTGALSYAYAMPAPAGTDDEVKVVFYNCFPLVAGFVPAPIYRWEADFVLHYTGSIPAYFYPFVYPPADFPHADIDFGWEAYVMYANTDVYVPVTWPIQLHYCDHVKVIIWMDIPQPVIEDATVEGLGTWLGDPPVPTVPLEFDIDFRLIQWNELGGSVIV